MNILRRGLSSIAANVRTGIFQNKSNGVRNAIALAILLQSGGLLAANLQDVSYSALPGGKVQIILQTDGLEGEPRAFSTSNPSRLAIDLDGTKSQLESKTTDVGIGAARSVTAVEAGDRTRVVVNLDSDQPYDISVSGNDVFVTIGSDSGASAPMQRASAAPATRTSAPSAAAGKIIENIDFRRGEAGEGRVMITLSDPNSVVDVNEKAGKINLDFMNTSVDPEMQRKLDVLDFATPVKTISTRQTGNNVQMTVAAVGDYEYLAYQADKLFTLEFRPLTKEEVELNDMLTRTYDGERLSLNFQDIEVRNVLQLLADFTDLNLVTSDSVRGNITLRLKNVPWDQALDIILKTKGLSMRKNDNVILVAPTEEIAAREKLELESMQQVEELAPLHSEFIQINYAKAGDLAALLKSPDNRLLSERGQVTVDDRTNTLLVQDTSQKLEDIHRLVRVLDIPIRQVMIESRLVIANNDFARELGVRFGVNGGTTRSSGNNLFVAGGGVEGFLEGSGDIAPGFTTGDDIENLFVNLPAAVGVGSGGAFSLLLGRLGTALLQLEISALQAEGRGEVVSSPRVITSDQNEAVIKEGFEIPYRANSGAGIGGTTTEFKDAVLELKVTPQITPDNHVNMELDIKKDRAAFEEVPAGIEPPIETRQVTTTVLVDNGETVVLGGVFERTKTRNKNSVPWFGDLPYLGWLFKVETRTDENRELLIFVTPKILKETLSAGR